MDRIKEIIWDEYSLDAYICISSGMKFNTPLSKEFFLQRNTAKNCYFTCIDLELVRYIGNLPVWGGSGRNTKLYRLTNIKYKKSKLLGKYFSANGQLSAFIAGLHKTKKINQYKYNNKSNKITTIPKFCSRILNE